jgi:hypothetical protein
MRSSTRRWFVTLGLSLIIWTWSSPAEALLVTELDFTSGAVNWDGRYGRILDRLFAQDGKITMGSYQSMSDIVDPITRGHQTFSLFTSGLNGAPTPSATINGSSISFDLSSLFLGISRGEYVQAWNIGGMGTGLFNPETSEFSLSWQHLFGKDAFKEQNEWSHHDDRTATFFLQGKAVIAQAPVALSASVVFYAIGLAGIGGLLWRRQSRLPMGTMSCTGRPLRRRCCVSAMAS